MLHVIHNVSTEFLHLIYELLSLITHNTIVCKFSKYKNVYEKYSQFVLQNNIKLYYIKLII